MDFPARFYRLSWELPGLITDVQKALLESSYNFSHFLFVSHVFIFKILVLVFFECFLSRRRLEKVGEGWRRFEKV